MSLATVPVAEATSLRSWKRDARLAQLGYKSYAAYIRSPGWKKRRNNILRDSVGCALCPTTDGLVVHHRTYERVGEEERNDLVSLCRSCHQYVHGLESAGYIESLEPEDAEALADEDRALTNQRDREQCKAEAGEAVRSVGEDALKCKLRSVNRQFFSAAMAANKRGIDVSQEIKMMNRISRRLRNQKPLP